MEKVNIREKLDLITDYWNPRIIGELNGQHVKAVKLKGDFVWHHHEKEDELFLVTKGVLKMAFRDETIDIHEGEFLIVPRMVEHRGRRRSPYSLVRARVDRKYRKCS